MGEQQERPRVNQFKLFCLQNDVKITELKQKSGLAIGTLNKMYNRGEATDKTIRLVSLSLWEDYQIDLSEEQISEMLKN